MKIQLIISIIVVSVTVVLVGWGVFQTNGSDAEVQTKLDAATPAKEKGDINATILNQKTLKDALTRPVFGNAPSNSDPNVGRDNPFEGI
jgi:hypothetical protein